jgi:peptide/nickel transport system ATP-binding protein
MIFITHELPLLYNVTDDIMVMYAGQIVEKGSAKEAVFDPLHPYAKGLMGSIIVPESGLRDVELAAIPGVPPNLKNPPLAAGLPNAANTFGQNAEAFSVGLRDEGEGGRAYRCILSRKKN